MAITDKLNAGASIKKMILKQLYRKIMERGKPEITEDLQRLILDCKLDKDGNFNILRTIIVNSKGEKDNVNLKDFKM